MTDAPKPQLRIFQFLLFGYSLLLTSYAIFSYSLTAPNLILSTWAPYWRFQTWMWQTFFNNRVLLTQTFSILILLITTSYATLVWFVYKNYNLVISSTKSLRVALLALALVSLPLLFASNALSYDIFNYIFNAKMVVVYQTNPHLKAAFEFAQSDDWLRFMHNIDTPAPYGYGWTFFSLLPYLLSGGKFIIVWFNFKLLGYLSMLVTAISLWWLSKQLRLQIKLWAWVLVFLNPFFLLEVIANSHNDLWMLWPSIIGIGLLVKNKKVLGTTMFSSILLLALSVSIKLVTVVLAPIWFWYSLPLKWRVPLSRFLGIKQLPVALICSILLFAPLLSPRSKLFLPWYLLWSFSWWSVAWFELQQISQPLLQRLGRVWLVALAVVAMTVLTRYLPYLWLGEYNELTTTAQLWFTWIPGSIVVVVGTIWAVSTVLIKKHQQHAS